MKVLKTTLDGVLIIEPDFFADERGFFMESYNESRYRDSGITERFVQDNISVSRKGVLRGLHYQAPPHAQGKLVSVLRGRVLDVAVDIRVGSPTYGKYVSVELSADNKKQLWIPAGFAHGFVALEDDTLFSYKCTDVYAPECDRGILWNDPTLAIDWGIESPLVSEKDRALPLLEDSIKEYQY